ncbi:MAG: GH3 family acyl-acid amido synthetase [Planctomycetota bacterium]|jgi:hypothetical protein
MGLVAKALSMVSNRRRRDFGKTAADPVGSQLKVLKDILRRAGDTEWGKKYGFSTITSPEAFRDRVPVTDYESMAPIWHKAFDGLRDVAWPGHVRFFALSSGTTSGDKLLPVTRDAIRSNRRSGADFISILVERGGADAIAGGRFFYLGGTTVLRERGKSLFGDASGIMGRHIPFYARSRYLPDREISATSNWEKKIDMVIDRYLEADVCALSACPSWAALLFKAMVMAAKKKGLGEKTVGELWPKLTYFVSYGMAFEPYRRSFEEYVGRPIHYVDTYSSSEAGMSAIQEEEGGPMSLIVDNGVYYEFVPVDREGETNPPRLHIGEVEMGKDYSVHISSNGGIWAYPLGDVVRFESTSPAKMVFSGRTQIFLSAFGEHVTLEEIETAMARASAETGAIAADYTVWPRIPAPEAPKPAHRWIIEFSRKPKDEKAFMSALDASIRSNNEDYGTHRTDDYGMDPPILIDAAPGTFYQWMKDKGKLGGQHKVPRVAMDPKMGDELVKITMDLS